MCAYPLREQLQRIPNFLPPKPDPEAGIPHVRLATNENTLGYSPLAAKAIEEAAASLFRYPDYGTKLRSRLAERNGIQPEQLVFGNGSFELLSLAAAAFLEAGEEAVIPVPSFGWYDIATLAAEGTPVHVPLREHAISLDDLLERVTTRTGLIWLCNPNNPTGTYFTDSELRQFMERVPSHVFVVLDEAYCEFVDQPDFPDSVRLVDRFPNLAVLRTFSKAYGLAGLRIGYAIAAADTAAALNRLRIPPNVNSLAEAAAAASVEDDPFLAGVQENNRLGKQFYYESFQRLGLSYLPTEANFILVNLERDSMPIFKHMLREGVHIRSGYDFDMPTWLRITIGKPEENRIVVEKLEQALQQ